MLEFDALDPFPLLSESAYSEAQTHSDQVDQWLGLRTYEIEASLKNAKTRDFKNGRNEQFWIGLPVKSLLTPYTEIRSILSHLLPSAPSAGDHVIDLGAGYGRMGFVIERHWPDLFFTGYECVAERVNEARRCMRAFGCSEKIQMKIADLSARDFKPKPAKFYFLYDYGSREAIDKTLQDLKELAKHQAVCVVGRGRASRDAIEREHAWLSQVEPARHYGNYSIYRSAL